MPIPCTTPGVVNGVGYPNWATRHFYMTGDACQSVNQSDARPIAVRAELVKSRVLPDGVSWERSPLADDPKQGHSVVLEVADLLALAAQDPDAAAAVAAVMTLLAKVGTQQGKL